jgi:hypothetical protein
MNPQKITESQLILKDSMNQPVKRENPRRSNTNQKKLKSKQKKSGRDYLQETNVQINNSTT